MNRILLFSLIHLAGIANRLSAQSSADFTKVFFEHYGVEQGLNSATVLSTLQDQEGFIWVGGVGGLYRFDGHEFYHFHDDLDHPDTGLSPFAGTITCLYEDHLGNIWIGTGRNGLKKLEKAGGHFKSYPTVPAGDSTDLRRQTNVTAIFEDANGRMWIGTPGGLFLLDSQKDLFKNVPLKGAIENPGRYVHVSRIFPSKGPNLLIATFGHGLLSVDRQTLEVKAIRLPWQDDPSLDYTPRRTSSILEDRQGDLWVGTSMGLYRQQGSEGPFRTYVHDPDDPGSINWTSISSILEDRDGDIWLSTAAGLNRFDRNHNRFDRFEYDEANPAGIGTGSPFYLMEDRQANIWVSTFGGGLNCLVQDQGEFRQYRTGQTFPGGGILPDVSALALGENGSIWISGGQGRLFLFDPIRQKLQPLNIALPDVADPDLRKIYGLLYVPETKMLWIGTSGLGVFLYHTTTGELKRLKDQVRLMKRNPHAGIFRFFQDKARSIYFTTNGVGLGIYDPARDSLHFLERDDRQPNTIPASNLEALAQDENGRFWLGTNGVGLICFDPASGRFETFREKPEDKNALISDRILSVFVDSRNEVWVCTSRGLDRYDKETGTFEHFQTKDGFTDGYVRCMQEDAQGNLWIATDQGMFRYDPRKKVFLLFDILDGLPFQEYIHQSVRDTASGLLYFGSQRGLLVFDPARFQANNFSPPVIITKTSFFYEGNYLNPVENIFIPPERTITIPPQVRMVELSLSNLNYHQAGKNRYSYKLEAQSTFVTHAATADWFDMRSERKIRFSNLNPGHYTLWLKGVNDDGVPSGRESIYTLIVDPPWWESTWAYSTYALGLAILFFFVRRFELNRRALRQQAEIERARAEEKQLQAEKIEAQAHRLEQTVSELTKKNNEIMIAQNQLIQQEKLASLGQLTAGIAHELKNPLNFVTNFAEGSIDLLDELMEEIKQNPNILPEQFKLITYLVEELRQNSLDIKESGNQADRIIHSMMDHARGGGSERQIMDLNRLVDDNVNLAYHGYRALDSSFHVQISKEFDADLPSVRVYPQELGRALLNLLNNACYAVSQKQRQSSPEYRPQVKIATVYHASENSAEIYIEDNGTGISEAIRAKIFEPFYTTKPTGAGNTGLGLSITYDIIVNQHHGQLLVDSREGEFSRFRIFVPIDQL